MGEGRSILLGPPCSEVDKSGRVGLRKMEEREVGVGG
jgi:hypothetical protein